MKAISLGRARRIALAAQGFDRPRPRRPDTRHLRRLVRELGLLQIDFVNVLVPAHYQVPFSRLGPYDRRRLDDLVYRIGDLTEQWAHQASIVPVDAWPLLRPAQGKPDRRLRAVLAFMGQRPGYVREVLREVRRRGPTAADELPEQPGARARTDWGWTRRKAALEAAFMQGMLAVARRREDSARVYDLTERLIPADCRRRRVRRDEAQRELLRRAARGHGVGTAGDLADYWRLPVSEVRPRIAELVDEGELERVRVDGWRDVAYLRRGSRAPRHLRAAALLSPFDPVVWHRGRVRRLFHFDYRVEIFVPASRRRFGHYVLPFLMGERLVARVDLKSDRARRRLRVLGAWKEPHAPAAEVAHALAVELLTMAAWLDLEGVSMGRRGDLARELGSSLRGQSGAGVHETERRGR